MLVLILSCFFVSVEYVLGECSNGCSEPVLLYETLKCRPIYASPNDCCPKSFDCSHIESRDNNYCHFKGKAYGIGENINDDHISGNCLIDCTCVEKRSGGKGFACAIFDCPEWLGLMPKRDCYFKYEPRQCCSSGEACPPFEATCKVNGLVYHEGRQFTAPDNKCVECVCKKGFVGKYEGPFCKQMECIDEVTNALDVSDFCAASYKSLDDCCPIQWMCPDNDNIVTAESVQSNDPKCRFGDRALNIGDKFGRVSPTTGGMVVCECRIPPYVTCIQDDTYPVYAGDYH